MRGVIMRAILAFQSTLSMRRATNLATIAGLALSISIHALHEESDRHATRH